MSTASTVLITIFNIIVRHNWSHQVSGSGHVGSVLGEDVLLSSAPHEYIWLSLVLEVTLALPVTTLPPGNKSCGVRLSLVGFRSCYDLPCQPRPAPAALSLGIFMAILSVRYRKLAEGSKCSARSKVSQRETGRDFVELRVTSSGRPILS